MGLFGGDTTVSNADRALQTDPQVTAQLAPAFAIASPVGGNTRFDPRVDIDTRETAGNVQQTVNIGLTDQWAIAYQQLVYEQYRELAAREQGDAAGAQQVIDAIENLQIAWQPTPAGGGGGDSGGGSYLMAPTDTADTADAAPAADAAPTAETRWEVLLLGITLLGFLME